MKKVVVIYNPNSGKKYKKNFIGSFEKLLSEKYDEVEIISSEYKGHITEIVKNIKNVSLVISVGGDGTFNEAMTGNFLRKERILLAHIPLGTTNDIGVMFGYGKDPIKNLKLLLDGEEKNIDICTINGKPFVYVAGFGKFMNIPYETSRKLKKRVGHMAYILEGAKEFFTRRTKLYDITYEVDGEEYSGLYSFMSISNATRIAGIKDFIKDVKLDDSKFEVLLCNITRKNDILKSLVYLTKNDITKVPGFYFHKVSSLKVKFNEDVKKNWCIDGEKLEDNSNTFEIKIEKNVKIMLPKKNIDKLFVK